MTLVDIFEHLFGNLKRSAENAKPMWIFPTGGYSLILSARLAEYLNPYYKFNTEKFAETLQNNLAYIHYPFTRCEITTTGDVITLKLLLPNINLTKLPPISDFIDQLKNDVELNLPFPSSTLHIEPYGKDRGIPDPLLDFFKSPPGQSIRISPAPPWLYKL